MRVYTPFSTTHRCTTSPQDIGDIHFPAGILVQVSAPVIHSSPKYWGDDSLDFRPSRWINDDNMKSETLIVPARGTFLPWSSGPRECPGSKMSQVEFIGVIRAIFSDWRVEILQNEGETKESARERFAKTVADSSPRVTLQLVRPQDAVLRWVKR
jgi:cytochrome P450